MNVAEQGRDPFCEDEADWSLRHYEDEHMVTTTFNPQTPPLLTPLLKSSARAQALRVHGGHCLNCNGTGHSMKTCSEGFLNTSGVLNPSLGQFNGGGNAYRQWQQRLRNLERNSNRYDNSNRYLRGERCVVDGDDAACKAWSAFRYRRPAGREVAEGCGVDGRHLDEVAAGVGVGCRRR